MNNFRARGEEFYHTFSLLPLPFSLFDFDLSFILFLRLGQFHSENAVLEGGGDGFGINAFKVKGAGEGAVGSLAAEVAFLIFFAFRSALGADGEVAVFDLGVDVLAVKSGEVAVKDVCVFGLADIGFYGRSPLQGKASLELLHFFERVE